MCVPEHTKGLGAKGGGLAITVAKPDRFLAKNKIIFAPDGENGERLTGINRSYLVDSEAPRMCSAPAVFLRS
jgi:hypothetical protein